MTAPLRQDNMRKGWCPGALRPMAARDGLLLRLRISGGILAADKAAALADLAERFGNGLFDLSARGNLQMRGLRADTLPKIQDDLSALGLIDHDAAGEAVRNVLASPLAGLHDGLDVRPLTAALEWRLVTDRTLHALPGKFGFLVDDGSLPTLAGVPADVRFDWDGERFAIGLGGDRSAERVGHCAAPDLVDEAARIAKVFLERSAQTSNVRRMRDFGTDVLRDIFKASPSPAFGRRAFPRKPEKESAHHTVGSLTFASIPVLGLAAPFGRLGAPMLRQAAKLASKTSYSELRLTPWRVILVPGTPADAPLIHGFITDPADARLAAAACVGVEGCSRGTTRTQRDAARLAHELRLDPADGITLHVSGCAKGCANASASAVTLVAADGRYDVVRAGRAGDLPWRRGLNLDEVRATLAGVTTSA